jgi:hypothetical protein
VEQRVLIPHGSIPHKGTRLKSANENKQTQMPPTKPEQICHQLITTAAQQQQQKQ